MGLKFGYKLVFLVCVLCIFSINSLYKCFFKTSDIGNSSDEPECSTITDNLKTESEPSSSKTGILYGKNYFERYPFLSKCDVKYKSQSKDNEPIEAELYEKRITRAVIFYFPFKGEENYMKEFRWVYRSWIEMQKYEPTKWRTDLIVFLDSRQNNTKYTKFEDINCKFTNKRTSNKDKPMCTLISLLPVVDRKFTLPLKIFPSIDEEYQYLYEKLDIFNHTEDNLQPFYAKLYTLGNYGYVDSILMAFEGYNYFKGRYSYIVRSDMDIFLTPLFSKWLPKTCNDFVVGGGGYSNDFNVNKLKRIATNLKMSFNGVRNLGSTWYASPEQFCLVSYLTLVSMAYLWNEEFTHAERKGEAGTLNWPEWHYAVLLLYGQNLGMNHLIATNQTNVVMYPELIDFGSGNERDIAKSVHIHVYHGDNIFSKFQFYAGNYDNETVAVENRTKTKYYCLYIALESKRLNGSALIDLANVEGNKKT